MKLIVKIEMNNAAFEDNQSGETCRILRKLADRLDGHPNFSVGHEQVLFDFNGNEVGFAGIADDDNQWNL
jgi:hypothetical protein